jgi:hypothetical protein
MSLKTRYEIERMASRNAKKLRQRSEPVVFEGGPGPVMVQDIRESGIALEDHVALNADIFERMLWGIQFRPAGPINVGVVQNSPMISASGVTVFPSPQVLPVFQNDPAIGQSAIFNALPIALSIVLNDPSIAAGALFAPQAQSLGVVQNAPTVASGGVTITPSAQGLSVVQNDPTITTDFAVSASVIAVGVALNDPSVQGVEFVAAATSTADSASAVTVSKPAGTVNGHVMIANLFFDDNSVAVTPPSGWTLVRRTSTAGRMMETYRKTASGEGADYSWSFDTSVNVCAAIRSYSNANGTPDTENGQTTASGTSHATPSITPSVANTMLVATFGVKANATWTPPSGMTERFDIKNPGGDIAMTGADVIHPDTSAVSKTATASSAGTGVTHMGALKA